MKEKEVTRLAVKKLSELLGIHEDSPKVSYHAGEKGSWQFDALYTSGSHKFAIESKSSSVLGQIVLAVESLKSAMTESPGILIPLVVVPHMGKSGREYCERSEVGWIDLSGNAKIVAPGLYINSTGHRSKFRRPGRVESAFGVKGSRVTRRLLINPGVAMRQRKLANTTGLDESYVSRVVRRLKEMGLVEITVEGVRVPNPDRLLDSWRDEYEFGKHRVMRGHVSPPIGESIIQVISKALSDSGIKHAATGFAAAWAFTHFAGHRLSTVYLNREPGDEILEKAGFRRESRGANTWLVVPNDDGVFDSSSQADGIWCVHPVQVYVDLKAHPERSSEAAEELRRRLLSWGRDGN